ncbi:MAG TPA: cupredoxin domain-containing protein [Candidatus Saccharimonadales bacterium]|nr:cupredoxin domain-containing protein [Candidatus Saccharimonadales bacterium]
MDNEKTIISSADTTSKNKYIPLLLIIILFVILGGFYLFQKNKSAKKQNVMGSETAANHPSGMPKRKMDPAMMKATTPVPLTDQQQEELTAGTSSATTDKIFTFTAGNFWFSPNRIAVNKGDKVTINFVVNNGFHDFVIDEFKVKVGPSIAGKTTSVTFTADKAGTFEFYCDIDHHRQKGQKGILIVQ